MLNQKVSFDQFGCNLFQVEQIQSRSRGAATLKELVEQDMANNTVKAADSNTTILLRLMRALQVVKVLFEQLLKGRWANFGKLTRLFVYSSNIITFIDQCAKKEVSEQLFLHLCEPTYIEFHNPKKKCECRGVEFQSAATTAYMVVFGAYHKEPIQNMVKRAISSLPTRAWLMNKINEEGEYYFVVIF